MARTEQSPGTTIAGYIHTADDRANYDAACKRLLSEKIILAWIMKSCLQEYQDCSVNEIAEKYIEGCPQVSGTAVAPDSPDVSPLIHGLGNEDTTMREGTVTYDIRFEASAPSSGELIRLIINVEAQNDFYPGYPLVKRGIYYCSRMISSQYGTEFTESHYGNIKKVYSIWICMNPPRNRYNSITRYYIAEENLVGHVKERTADYDLMSAIMICPGSPEEEDYTGILKLLDILLSTKTGPDEKCRILENEFQIGMTQTLESEVSLMCNLSKGVEEKGIRKGIEQGIKQGLEQGLEQGILGAILMCRDMDIPDETIKNKLQTRFHLTEEEAVKYLKESVSKTS